jgi:hypothetical protein
MLISKGTLIETNQTLLYPFEPEKLRLGKSNYAVSRFLALLRDWTLGWR